MQRRKGSDRRPWTPMMKKRLVMERKEEMMIELEHHQQNDIDKNI